MDLGSRTTRRSRLTSTGMPPAMLACGDDGGVVVEDLRLGEMAEAFETGEDAGGGIGPFD